MADKTKLTDKQERFVQELLKGKTQREAYKIAFNPPTMSDKCIDEEACKLFNAPKINQRYNTLHDKLIKKAEEECIVDAKKVLEELSHIAFDDIRNYLSFKTVKTVVGTDKDTGEPIIDYKTVIDIKDSDTIDTRNIAEVQQGPNGTFKFKQYCKDNALIQLGKHFKLFTDKLEHTGANGGAIQMDINKYTDEEIDKILKVLGYKKDKS